MLVNAPGLIGYDADKGRNLLNLRQQPCFRPKNNRKFAIMANDPNQQNNPLHGKTLERILNELVARYGWPALGHMIRINCFNDDPSVKSSLKFLRKTPWARKKVEDLYVYGSEAFM